MPNSPTVKTEYTPGQGQNYPVTSTLSAPPVTPIYPTSGVQTGAVAVGTVNVTFPTGAVGAVVTAKGALTLSAWPRIIALKANQTGSALVTASLAVVVPQLLVGMPSIVLTFGAGSPLYAPGTGIATFALQAGRTYATPSVSFTLTALIVQTYANPLVVPISVGAVLYGLST